MDVSIYGPYPRDMALIDERELLSELRDGNLAAYGELWCRHHRAAMTFATQIAPTQAEDLVSESFTAVLHTITVSRKGPVDGFRAYLFATMRNSAARLSKEGRAIINVANIEDFEVPDERESNSLFDSAADSAALIRAFQALPTRWQKILWLSEVEDAPRSAIAKEFNLRPNAVSALSRRAKVGFRLQYLLELLPLSLREDQRHVAQKLPSLVAGKLTDKSRSQVKEHIKACEKCSTSHSDLSDAWRRLGNHTLGALGFGALGIILMEATDDFGAGASAAHAVNMPEVTPEVLASSGAGIAATASFGFGAKVAAVIASALLLVQVTGSTPNIPFGTGTAAPHPQNQQNLGALAEGSVSAADFFRTLPEPFLALAAINEESSHGGTPDPGPPEDELTSPAGRFSGDDWVPFLDFGSEPSTLFVPAVPPAALPPEDIVRPPGPDSPAPTLDAPVLSASPASFQHIAPVLTGFAQPSAVVLIEVFSGSSRATLGYSDSGPEVGPEESPEAVYATSTDVAGEWSFDLSPLDLPPGYYRTSIWQIDDGQASAATEATFQLATVGVTLLSHTSIDYLTAELDGLPVDFNGPVSGTICLVTDTDQRFDIPLDPAGEARRFIRFVGSGDYDLRFMSCDGDRYGPTHNSIVEVVPEGTIGFGGFGVEPEGRTVIVVE